MTRCKAAGIHLALSALVLGTVAAFAIWNWYPPGLLGVAKADKLLLTLTGVDVVLGPLLTLIIYRQGKPSLKFDLAVIAALQFAALGFGLNTLWQSRPVYLVAATDRFQLVFANEIAPEDLRNAPPEYRHLPVLGVRTIAARLPEDPRLRQKALFASLGGGKDIYLIPANYVPFAPESKAFAARATPVVALLDHASPAGRDGLLDGVRRSGKPAQDLVAVPIDSIRGSAAMLLDAHTGEVAGPAAADIWPMLEKTAAPR